MSGYTDIEVEFEDDELELLIEACPFRINLGTDDDPLEAIVELVESEDGGVSHFKIVPVIKEDDDETSGAGTGIPEGDS